MMHNFLNLVKSTHVEIYYSITPAVLKRSTSWRSNLKIAGSNPTAANQITIGGHQLAATTLAKMTYSTASLIREGQDNRVTQCGQNSW